MLHRSPQSFFFVTFTDFVSFPDHHRKGDVALAAVKPAVEKHVDWDLIVANNSPSIFSTALHHTKKLFYFAVCVETYVVYCRVKLVTLTVFEFYPIHSSITSENRNLLFFCWYLSLSLSLCVFRQKGWLEVRVFCTVSMVNNIEISWFFLGKQNRTRKVCKHLCPKAHGFKRNEKLFLAHGLIKGQTTRMSCSTREYHPKKFHEGSWHLDSKERNFFIGACHSNQNKLAKKLVLSNRLC